VSQGAILAFTFTNKAAREMRERVERLLGGEDVRVWLGTFHATCVRVLRRHAESLGYPRSFVIYDTDDQRSLLRSILREEGGEDRTLTPAGASARISDLKNRGITPAAFEESARGPIERKLAPVYAQYARGLRDRAAMDFDDLILNVVRLFDLDEAVHRQYA